MLSNLLSESEEYINEPGNTVRVKVHRDELIEFASWDLWRRYRSPQYRIGNEPSMLWFYPTNLSHKCLDFPWDYSEHHIIFGATQPSHWIAKALWEFGIYRRFAESHCVAEKSNHFYSSQERRPTINALSLGKFIPFSLRTFRRCEGHRLCH